MLISITGEYICELETYGDPIHQVNKLHVLGEIFIIPNVLELFEN